MATTECNVEFRSQGVTCRGLFVRPLDIPLWRPGKNIEKLRSPLERVVPTFGQVDDNNQDAATSRLQPPAGAAQAV